MDIIASITQFTSVSFYHFIMEVLPRLLLLRPKLAESKSLKVLVPKVNFVGNKSRDYNTIKHDIYPINALKEAQNVEKRKTVIELFCALKYLGSFKRAEWFCHKSAQAYSRT